VTESGRQEHRGAGLVPAPFPWLSLGLGALAFFIALVPGADAALVFQREAIAAGELWRLLTGHWVHWSTEHLMWDVGTLVALGVACEAQGRARLAATVLASALAISAVVWWLLPGLESYAGLSGIDCALFARLGMELWREHHRRGSRFASASAVAFGAALAFKVSLEWTTGGTVFVAHLGPGIVPVPAAHLAGAAVGVALPVAVSRELAEARS
jgi:rhomboid family GlyGly-CTERM serine protease